MGRKKKRSSGVFMEILLVVAIGVFCFSGFQLYKIYKGYNEGENEYEEIYNEVISIQTRTDQAESSDEEKEAFIVDFDKLEKMNPDVVGWIRFKEPSIINYPIVYGDDNDEYLHKTFQGYPNTVGSIFVNAFNHPDFEDKNTIIYGHRMYNGTMFDELGKYEKKEFWEKYPYFYIYRPDGAELKYHIYSVAIVHETSDIYDWVFKSDAEFSNFIEETKQGRFYDTEIEVGVNDEIVILSTCTNDNEEERLVVIGVRTEVNYGSEF